jgi:hypothetical protein
MRIAVASMRTADAVQRRINRDGFLYVVPKFMGIPNSINGHYGRYRRVTSRTRNIVSEASVTYFVEPAPCYQSGESTSAS